MSNINKTEQLAEDQHTFETEQLAESKYTFETEQLAEGKHTFKREEISFLASLKSIAQKILRFISFVDLPINKKFMLFSFGVLFWFIVMFAINMTASVDVNNKTGIIINQLVPLDRAIQKITVKLQNLNIDMVKIRHITEAGLIDQKINSSRAKIKDVQSFVSVLETGGLLTHVNRETTQMIESFDVPPIAVIPEVKRYVDDMRPLIVQISSTLSEIADFEKMAMNTGNALLEEKINEYGQFLSQMIGLSNEYLGKFKGLYSNNYQSLGNTLNITFYIYIGVLIISTALLFIFTLTITRSLALPIKSIIEQIKSLGAGKVDLSKKISIRSKDEVGILTRDFNKLTREIYDIVTFKKVIEEDDNLEDVYSRLGKAFREKCGLNEFIIYEVSHSNGKMKPVYPLILNEKEIFCNEAILDNCELCKVTKTGHEISSMTYPEICKLFKPDMNRTHLCIPMIISGKTGGVVQFLLEEDKSIGEMSKQLFKAEQYIKESLSVIEAKRLMNTLKESALKDPLTGLYNRRFLQEYTETLVGGAKRREQTVGLIMCDLDYFKQVNDSHGHNVGDTVLKETANSIKKCLRSSDLVIRFGGEEFLIILLDVDDGESFKIAEKIRETIEKLKVKIPDGSIQKTISLGISEFPGDTKSFWQAIKFADVSLYKAKERGRNKAVRFTEDMWSGKNF